MVSKFWYRGLNVNKSTDQKSHNCGKSFDVSTYNIIDILTLNTVLGEAASKYTSKISATLKQRDEIKI